MKSSTLLFSMNPFNSNRSWVKLLLISAILNFSPFGVNHAKAQQTSTRAAMAPQSVTLSVTTLSNFRYTVNYGPSDFQYFKVSGTNLTGDITITPPTNYEISTVASTGYQSTAITLTPTSNTVASTNIFVRLKGGLAIGTYNSQNIVVASSGTTSKNVACNGSVVDLPSISVTAIDGVCSGATFSLSATNQNAQNLYWMGPNNFYSVETQPTFTNATSALNGTYTLTGTIGSGVNLITNGDFESGNSGFSSVYTYTTTDLHPEGTYAVIANPKSLHADFSTCANNNDYGTLQMVINGAGTAGSKIWYQTVAVKANTQYQFTYYVQSVHPTSPSIMQLYANGVAVGPSYTASSSTCLWKKFVYVWNSGSTTSVELALINQNTALSGNDFALDNITFQETATASASATITVGSSLPIGVAVSMPAADLVAGKSATFTAIPTNGGTNPSYQWYKSGNAITGATQATYTYIPQNGDALSVQLNNRNPASCYTGNPATSATVNLVVYPVITASVAIAVDKNNVCDGTSVTFTATPTNGGTNPTYQWYKGTSAINGATLATYSYIPQDGDVIKVVMTSNNPAPGLTGSPATSNSITMTVAPKVTASIAIVASKTVINAGETITFTATPTNGGTTPSYQWKVNGTNSGTDNTVFSYAPANNDVVTCDLSSSIVCINNASATSNAITITHNFTTESINGQTDKNDLTAYVVGKTVYVKNNSKESNYAYIFDMTGKLVQSNLFKANATTAIASHLNPGIYLIKLSSNNTSKVSRINIR